GPLLVGRFPPAHLHRRPLRTAPGRKAPDARLTLEPVSSLVVGEGDADTRTREQTGRDAERDPLAQRRPARASRRAGGPGRRQTSRARLRGGFARRPAAGGPRRCACTTLPSRGGTRLRRSDGQARRATYRIRRTSRITTRVPTPIYMSGCLPPSPRPQTRRV